MRTSQGPGFEFGRESLKTPGNKNCKYDVFQNGSNQFLGFVCK